MFHSTNNFCSLLSWRFAGLLVGSMGGKTGDVDSGALPAPRLCDRLGLRPPTK